MKHLNKIMILILCFFLLLMSTSFAQHWVDPTLEKWESLGFISNKETIPLNSHITRGEFSRYINTVYSFEDKADMSKYTDISKFHPYYNDLAIAVKEGYIEGYNGKISPNGLLNRSELSVILCKLTKTEPQSNEINIKRISDYKNIPGWAIPWLSTAYEQKLLIGNKNIIDPLGMVTHAQAIQALDNTLNIEKGTLKDGFMTYNNYTLTKNNLENSIIKGNLIIDVNLKEKVLLNNVIVKGSLIIKSNNEIQLVRSSVNSLKANSTKKTTISLNYSDIKFTEVINPLVLNIDQYSLVKMLNIKNTFTASGSGTIERIFVNSNSNYKIDSKLKIIYPIQGANSNSNIMGWLNNIDDFTGALDISKYGNTNDVDLYAPIPHYTPNNGSANAPLDTIINIFFDEPILIEENLSISNLFTFVDKNMNSVDFTVIQNNNTFIITPDDLLEKNNSYMITIKKNAISDTSGNKLSAATLVFETEKDLEEPVELPDIFAPEITPNFNPFVAVSPDFVFELSFSEEVILIEDKVIADNVFISEYETKKLIPSTITYDSESQKITIIPDEPLTTEHEYILSVNKDLFEDSSGNKNHIFMNIFMVQ